MGSKQLASIVSDPGVFKGARLTLVVEFPIDVEQCEVEQIIDEARSYGSIRKATFERLAPHTTELK